MSLLLLLLGLLCGAFGIGYCMVRIITGIVDYLLDLFLRIRKSNFCQTPGVGLYSHLSGSATLFLAGVPCPVELPNFNQINVIR
jgi:hypothetical protein